MTTQNLSPTVQRYQLPVLVLILLLAAAGRIINIDVESLWVDEGFSYSVQTAKGAATYPIP